jgi:hypothetical protein
MLALNKMQVSSSYCCSLLSSSCCCYLVFWIHSKKFLSVYSGFTVRNFCVCLCPESREIEISAPMSDFSAFEQHPTQWLGFLNASTESMEPGIARLIRLNWTWSLLPFFDLTGSRRIFNIWEFLWKYPALTLFWWFQRQLRVQSSLIC